MKYKHILLAIDFSKGDIKVEKKARELANQMGAKLSAIHVIEPLPGYGYNFVGATEIESHLIEETKKQLSKVTKRLNVDEKNQHIEMGLTKVEITNLAEKIHADLIVVGSHSHHGLAKLLGSTANSVVHNAHCDVLTIRFEE